jgi:predicted membrane-bound spermidine synthase
LLGLTAFASLLNEIAWTRVLIMVVGGSTYAFTLVLLVFLLGIGLGSMFVARRSMPRAETAASAALAQGITGVGAAVLFLFFGFLPSYIISVFQVPDLSAASRLFLMGVAVGAVVLIPAIGMGMTFPLLTDLTARARRATGADVGAAYALNTIGSILGAVVTGFVLVSVLGTQVTLRVGLVINGLAALGLAVWVSRGVAEGSGADRRIRARVLAGATLGIVALVIGFVGPGWSNRLIDLAPTIYARERMDATTRRLFLSHRGVRQLAFREGRNATVSVWESETGRSLRVNGKVDASDRGDMDTQVMLGLAPAVARSGATSAFVIGYGSGVTARVLAAVPGMQRVRIAEIEPAVLEMDSLFHGVNDTVLRRPGVHAIADDARSALQLDQERYDIIVSEPSNPWIAGIATLYTPEFFRIARNRLKDNGVLSQWVQLYQLPLPIVAGIVRNIRAEFPHVEIWFGEPADLIVLASPAPIAFDSGWVRRLIGTGGPLSGVAHEWLNLDTPSDYFGFRLLGEQGVSRLIARATFAHNDDHPRLEFVAARRFLDFKGTVTATFDSLVQLGLTDGDAAPPLLLTRSVAMRRTDAAALRYVEWLRKNEPGLDEYVVRSAAIHLGLGDTVAARLLLAEVYGHGRTAGRAWADAMLLGGLIATASQEPLPRAVGFLEAALVGGADTAQARAALALLAIRNKPPRWSDAAAQARSALASGRGTFRHPYPPQFLHTALAELALDGPPALADSVLGYAVARRPGSARYRELATVAALRAGRCDEAAAGFVELLEFAVQRDNGTALVRECWAGQEPTAPVTPVRAAAERAKATH